MTELRVEMFVHLVLAILLTGYCLFWYIMASAADGVPTSTSKEVLEVASGARWPPAGPLWARVPISVVGWGLLLAIAATGLMLAETRGLSVAELVVSPTPYGVAMTIKLGLLGLLLFAQGWWTVRPSRFVAYASFLLILGILLASAYLVH